jgi:hypothetical protein
VDAWIFHAFHIRWISELMKALNAGLLPPEYYALAELVAPRTQTDGLMLPARWPASPNGRRLVVRHLSGHQVVAVIEIVSPSNKDRKQNVRELAEKVVRSLEAGIHVLVIDLLPPGPHDPQGIHGAVWTHFDTAGCEPPADGPLTLASYAWDGSEPSAYVEPVAVGQPLIDMPLFLTAQRYVNVPLEATYQTAYGGMPAFWREVLERAVGPKATAERFPPSPSL